MADDFIPVLGSTDPAAKKVDNSSLTVGVNTVDRQRIVIGSDTAAAALAAIINAAPAGTEFALVVRNIPSGTQPVSAASLPLPAGAATDATVSTKLSGGLPAALGAGGGLKVDGSGTALPVDSELTTADLDTGAGVDTRAVVGLVRAESGGGLLVGSANPMPISAASLPLPTNAATDRATAAAPEASRLSDGTAFYDAAKTGQLPAALGAGGGVKIDGSGTALPVSNGGTFPTQPTLQAGSNLAGRFNPEPQTANGLSIARVISAATTNATSVKASAGQVYVIMATNTNAAPRFLKLYNKASAPTVGTDTPVMTFLIPGNTAGAGFTLDTGGMGFAFGTGIALAITGAVADADTTAVAANECVVNLGYK